MFAPSLWATIATVLLGALFVNLGQWQLNRAHEKQKLFDEFAAGTGSVASLPLSMEPLTRYQRVRVRGLYDSRHQFVLDNMTNEGRPGFHILTPLVLFDGRVLIVNRGWIPLGADRSRFPDLSVPEGEREITGRVDTIPRAPIELVAPASTSWPRVVNFPHMEQLAAALDRKVYPQVLLLDASAPDGYVRNWQPPGFGPERHIGYAVQWFGLAVTLLVIYVVLNLRKESQAS